MAVAAPAQLPLDLQVFGKADGNGAATIPLELTPSRYQVFNLALSVPGSGSQQTTVQLNGQPAQQGFGQAPQLGPIWTKPNDSVQVVVSGATPGSSITGRLQGAEALQYADLPELGGPANSNVVIEGGNVTLSGPVTITGPVTVSQADPSQLLIGAAGAPLFENLSVSVPGTGSHEYVLPQSGLYTTKGYSAILFYGDPAAAAVKLFARVVWEDLSGIPIAYYQLDSLIPKFAAVLPVLGAQLQINLWNNDSAAHVISGLTCIPLAQSPSRPELLIPTAFGADPATITPTTPSAPVLINANPTASIPASGGQLTLTANFVWPGRALLAFYTGSATYSVQVDSLDATGAATFVHKFGNIANGALVELELPPGQARVVITNNGSSAITPSVSMVATS